MTDAAEGPLADIVVLDLSRALAGPHATMLLGDLGARVIKVEPPGGDDSRGYGPPFVGPDEISTYYLCANRNKESIVLDLRADDGRDTLTRLVRHADVVVENFRPGVLARLGFAPERLRELNPRLVVLSITGFGHDGPEGGRAGYDQIAQGEAGLMSVTGPTPGEPTRVGVPVADLLAGLHGAYGVVAALHERDRTGRGQVVRTSLLASVVGIHAFQGTAWTVGGVVPGPTGNHHPAISPYGLFHCRDGFLHVCCGSEALWARFAGAVGLDPAAPGMTTNRERVENRPLVTAAIEERFAGRDLDDLLAALDAAGVPAGRVRSMDEVYGWEQTRSQGLVVTVEHPGLGPVELPGPPLRFDDLPYAGGRPSHTAPPALDQDAERVRAWLDARDAEG